MQSRINCAGEEAGVYIDFEMSTRPHVALSVALVFHHLPAEPVLHLHVALRVLVGVPAVVKKVATLAN